MKTKFYEKALLTVAILLGMAYVISMMFTTPTVYYDYQTGTPWKCDQGWGGTKIAIDDDRCKKVLAGRHEFVSINSAQQLFLTVKESSK